MNISKVMVLLFLTFIISACANNGRTKMEKIFVTNISESGFKIFSFSLVKDISKQVRKSGKGSGIGSGKGKGMGGGKHGRGGQSQQSDEDMAEKLKYKTTEALKIQLIDSGYCRDGYIEIESYFLRGTSQIRGECNEPATDEDRAKFINI